MTIPTLPEDYTDIDHLYKWLREKPELYWQERGKRRALLLFHLMAQRVPAYRDFLKKHKISHDKIKKIEDFRHIPPIDKQNYLRFYPREALCWDGEFATKQWTISITSGSTGEPYYFPREQDQDMQYALTAELYLRMNFEIHKKTTLYIVGFPMGAWIGGVFTLQALSLLAKRGKYQLSIITPGINKLEIIKAVKNLGSHFDQILIGSYAPFLKDILDDGERYGLKWKEYKLGFIFSAEGFSETFRDYVAKKTTLKNIYTDTLNHYGTVDLGTMSHETPLCILLRKLGIKDKQIYDALFKQTLKLPTLTQYNPELFYFEDVNGNLYCSAFSGFPLVRYDLKDHGGVLGFDMAINRLRDFGCNVLEIARELHLDHTIWHLPFVYVYERSDFSVSFFAFQIYPETVRKALQDSTLEESITGKFTMQVIYDDKGNQVFEIHVELKSTITITKKLEKQVQLLIIKKLLEENSEYRKTHEEYGERVFPHITFWPYEDPTFFKPGVKQKWVKK